MKKNCRSLPKDLSDRSSHVNALIVDRFSEMKNDKFSFGGVDRTPKVFLWFDNHAFIARQAYNDCPKPKAAWAHADLSCVGNGFVHETSPSVAFLFIG